MRQNSHFVIQCVRFVFMGHALPSSHQWDPSEGRGEDTAGKVDNSDSGAQQYISLQLPRDLHDD